MKESAEADWKTAYVGLGANLGDRERTLRAAVETLDGRDDVRVTDVSELRETEPVGGPPQGLFLNGAVRLRTTLGPGELLTVLQAVENAFGRTRTVRWGPRTLDLDLLLYEDRVVRTPSLEVPHPRMHRRRFVLEPLCDLCPELEHPVLGKSVRELLDRLGAGPEEPPPR